MATASDRKEQPRITALRFSTNHGQNVLLKHHGKSAEWKLSCHCGTCCTSRSLPKGEKLDFKISGSGHVLLGLMSHKPETASTPYMDITKVEPTANYTHFRFKKETTRVTLSRTKSREVKFSREMKDKTEENTFPIQGQDLFVFFEIQFGDIVIEITSDSSKKTICFDAECGSNMILEQQGKRASLKQCNLSALCCTDRPLAPGEVIDLHISAKDGASWTYVKLFVSNQNGSQLQLQNVEVSPDSFLYPSEGIKVDKKGTVQIRVSEAGEIVYSVQTREARKIIGGDSLDLYQPLYLCVELFRVKAEIESTLPEEDATYLTASFLTEDDTYLLPVSEPRPSSSTGVTGYPEVPSLSQPDLPDREYTTIPDETLVDIFPDPSQTFLKDPNADLNSRSAMDKIKTKKQQGEKPESSSDEPMTIPFPRQYREELGGGATEASGPTQGQYSPQRQPTGGSSGPESFEPPSTSIPQDAMPFQVFERLTSQLESVLMGTQRPSGVQDEPNRDHRPVSSFGEKIRTNYVQLLDRLEPDPIADHLFQSGNISDAEQYSFHEKDKKAKSRFILHILTTRPRTKDTFIIALQQSAQGDIVDLLGLQ
ncbi:uncharacterized protein [Haliotis asinina]|uniref:uncharacterized protein n=1 Tax=Haliotis asinina TaxID=109174 RepID=UPI003532787B